MEKDEIILSEKMVVWYELRYPDYELNKLIPFTFEEQNNERLLVNNPYLNIEMPQYIWSKFYNPKAFISSLSQSEKKLC